MINREKGGKITIACDACPAVLKQEGGWRPYNAVWKDAQAKGWSARAVGKDWKHDCPNCSKAPA
jgi:hypothetical protein